MNCFYYDPTLNMDPVPMELVGEGQDCYIIVVSQKLNALLTMQRYWLCQEEYFESVKNKPWAKKENNK